MVPPPALSGKQLPGSHHSDSTASHFYECTPVQTHRIVIMATLFIGVRKSIAARTSDGTTMPGVIVPSVFGVLLVLWRLLERGHLQDSLT